MVRTWSLHIVMACCRRIWAQENKESAETRGAVAMMTVVTTVTLKDEASSQWDRAMHERVRGASDMDGWVAVQLLTEVNEPRRRAIIGTWQSRDHWARWHDDETFKATRAELAGLEDGPSTTVWYDVVEDQA
jgi:heme-degrading monooxygenase HmoA